MVQYASFGNFYSNYGNFQNFDFALIFIVMHYTSSYISINSRNTLDNYRMRYNIWELFPWVCTKHPKLGVFCYFLKYSILVAGISQLVNKLQQWSLYEVIKDNLPLVLGMDPDTEIVLCLCQLQDWEFLSMWLLWLLDK